MLKLVILIITSILFFNCNAKKITKDEKSQKVKEKISIKQKKEYNSKHKKAVKKYYDMQPESTKETMKLYKSMSDDWNKKSFSKNEGFLYKIKKFIKNIFTIEKKPKDGLFGKNKQKRKKSNIFKKIFNKKKH